MHVSDIEIFKNFSSYQLSCMYVVIFSFLFYCCKKYLLICSNFYTSSKGNRDKVYTTSTYSIIQTSTLGENLTKSNLGPKKNS